MDQKIHQHDLNRDDHTPRPVRFSSYATTALTVILTVEIIAIGAYSYSRMQAALQPENVANLAEEAIREHYPEFRQQLVAQIEQEAPAIAQQASHEMIASAPEAREELQRLTIRQLDQGLSEAADLSQEKFSELLRENRAEIEQALERIEEAPEEAKELLAETEADFQMQFGVDLQEQAENALAAMRNFNERLRRLSETSLDELSRRAQLEVQIIRIVRAMQERRPEEVL